MCTRMHFLCYHLYICLHRICLNQLIKCLFSEPVNASFIETQSTCNKFYDAVPIIQNHQLIDHLLNTIGTGFMICHKPQNAFFSPKF